MEEKEVLENLSKSISERLKVPIIVTYISVLIIYNWDILFYLFFENSPASARIKAIKESYSNEYIERILISLAIAVVLIILFTILNTLINLGLKWFYRKDKETSLEIENYKKIDSLAEQLSQSIKQVNLLQSKIKNLETINRDLTSKSLDIQIGEISKKDYNRLISYLNNKDDNEKYLYSLKELIKFLKKDIHINLEDLINHATYHHEMRELIDILQSRKLISLNRISSTSGKQFLRIANLSKSFEDILQMEEQD